MQSSPLWISPGGSVTGRSAFQVTPASRTLHTPGKFQNNSRDVCVCVLEIIVQRRVVCRVLSFPLEHCPQSLAEIKQVKLNKRGNMNEKMISKSSATLHPCRVVVLKVWSPDHQHWHHLGTYRDAKSPRSADGPSG